MLKKIWHLCGSVKLTFYLLLFISLNAEKTLKLIRFLDPLSRHGLSFHLVAEKKAGAPKMKIIVKDDPGVNLILWGFTVMVLLMLWYFPQMNKAIRGGK